MNRTLAALLTVTVASSACAVRAPARSLQAGAAPQRVVADADVWRRFARELPVGSMLNITTATDRFSGTLLAADDESLTVQPKTRVPEPLRRIAFDQIVRIEPVSDRGTNVVKAIAVGAAVGAGTFLGLLMLALAGWD